MTRGGWIAVLVLIATNVAWAVAWFGGEGRDAVTPEREVLEGEVERLETEVRQLRAAARSEAPAPGLNGVAPEDLGLPADAPHAAEAGSPDEAMSSPEADEAARITAQEQARAAAALAQVKEILRKVMQVKDSALREEGLGELRTALASTDPILVEYALSAMHSMRDVQVDRSAFRQTVLDLLDSPNAGIRRSALYALHATGVQEGDAQRALAAAQDPDPKVRAHALGVLKLYGVTAQDGVVAAAAVKLLADDEPIVRRGALRGLSDTAVGAQVERTLIELAQRPENRRVVVQEGLSTLKNKSHAVVDALFTCLTDDDQQIRARAHWGLQRDVAEAEQPYVARRYTEHLETFLSPQSHREALKIIARHGDASLVPQLERFADNELVDPGVRAMTAKVIEYLRAN